MHWQPILNEIRARKLDLARLDPRGGMPIMPPAGASAEGIAAVRRKLGRPLPPSYRELLAQYDGLPHLYQGASLLGVRQLMRGTYVIVTRLTIELDGTHLEDDDRCPTLIPFGIDAAAETIFAWDLGAPRKDGELGIVLWMNDIGARAFDFPSFLDLILEMLAADIEERRCRSNPVSKRCPVVRLTAFDRGAHAA